VKPRLTGERWITSSEKRAFDIAAAIALMPVAIPAGALTLALCRFFEGDEALFTQERYSKGGVLFPMRKIRTMRPAHLKPGETSQITRIGKVVRPLGLDEIPQLLNILKGDMSITGPRAYEPWRTEEMIAALPTSVADEWKALNKIGRAGGISTFGIQTRGNIPNDERTYLAKAMHDIQDGRDAILRHDLELLRRAGAMGVSVVRRQFMSPENVADTTPSIALTDTLDALAIPEVQISLQ
jgi:hypothetical protein